MSDYYCAKCGQRSSMMGHWRGEGKPFSCEVKGNDMARAAPLVQRTDGEREAYQQGFLAALELSIGKVDSTISTAVASARLKNVREGFLVARGESK